MKNGNEDKGMVITPKERDSLYSKMQKGKHAVQQVKVLDSALAKCDASKIKLREALAVSQKEIDSLVLKTIKQKEIEDNLNKNINDEIKKGRKKGFWNFVKGTVVGAAIIGAISAVSG